MHYTVRKTGKNWTLNRKGTVLGKYPTKAAALLTGRVLAGWAGTVTVARA